MRYFNLPDLGEGLQEAELVKWHVAVGDEVTQDQIIASVETAKAIVDLPSPNDGKIHKLFGEVGDILQVGDPLIEYDSTERQDTGTVVGKVETSDTVINEKPIPINHSGTIGIKATPAVRALAHRFNVDLALVKPSGRDDAITAEDVHRVAKLLAESGEMVPLKGVRRAMAQTMSLAHAEVVPVTISDDADIEAWQADEDVSIRLIRAIMVGCKAESSLNAWYDNHAMARIVLKKLDLGIAVDTGEGLFVPVLRNISERQPKDLRKGLDAIKNAVQTRSIPPEEMRGYTFILSNFGTFAGRYANPIIVPPTVAILGAGKIRPQVVAADNQPAVHKILPISLTFDHRAVTGGEAARFLAAALADLEAAE